MTEEQLVETKHPIIEFLFFIIPAIVAFFGIETLYQATEAVLIAGVENSFLVIGIKLILFFIYLIPLAIAVLLLKVKNFFVHIIALVFLGLGFGVVFKIALWFVGIISPYSF